LSGLSVIFHEAYKVHKILMHLREKFIVLPFYLWVGLRQSLPTNAAHMVSAGE